MAGNGSFSTDVRSVLADPMNLPPEFLDYLIQYAAQNPVPTRNPRRDIYSLNDYGASGKGTTDDTNAFKQAIEGLTSAGQGILYLPPGDYIAEGVTIPANVTLMGHGATLKGKDGGTANILVLSSGCRIHGLEIDGNKANRTAGYPIVTSSATDVQIRDCYIHDSPTRGIELDSTSTYLVAGNRIEGCVQQAIMCNFSSGGRIQQNIINNCAQGIEVWGGNANPAPGTIGVSSVDVVGNVVTNTTGAGIWSSCGERVAFVGNILVTIGDVALDFEGCIHCSATGNIVRDATNGALTCFFASSHVNFNSNQIRQSGAQAGIYIHGGGTSSFINICDNEIHTNTGVPIRSDSTDLTDAIIANNLILMDSNTTAMLLIDGAGRCNITGNRITMPGGAANLTGIELAGLSDSLVANNYVLATTADTGTTAGNSGGIFLVWRSSTYPCKRNTVIGNYVKGFFQSITDDPNGGDANSFTLIKDNRVDTVYQKTGAVNLVTGNVSTGNPNTAVTATNF